MEKQDPTPANPHDAFVREIWSREEVAWDFLIHYLPPAIAERLVAGSLKLRKESFVDKALRKRFSDLLYQVRLKGGGTAYIYVLFEHKSYPDRWIWLQLLIYLVRIWEGERRSKKKRLTPVLPLVLYHGRRGWRVGKFTDLFEAVEGLEGYIPSFGYELCDVSHLPDAQLRGQVLLRVTLLILKYIFRPELNARLPEALGLLQALSDKGSVLEYLQVLLKYLAVGAEQVDEEVVKQAVQTALADEEGRVMATLAQKWLQQGIEKGIERGREETARQAVIKVLEIRFGSVPEEAVRRLGEIHDVNRLQRLLEVAVKAPALGDLVDDPHFKAAVDDFPKGSQ